MRNLSQEPILLTRGEFNRMEKLPMKGKSSVPELLLSLGERGGGRKRPPPLDRLVRIRRNRGGAPNPCPVYILVWHA